MSSFDWEGNIGDSIDNGQIIKPATTGIFYALKAFLETVNIVEIAGGRCGGV